jgi:hypothetical protein
VLSKQLFYFWIFSLSVCGPHRNGGLKGPNGEPKAIAIKEPAMLNIMQKNELKGVYLTKVSNTDTCFLTFHRPVTIYSDDIVDWQVGAYRDKDQNNHWVTINDTFIQQKKNELEHKLLWGFSSDTSPRLGYLDLFSETIYSYWKGFTHQKRGDYFKGRTFGKAHENCPGLVMKALKVGFNALGIVKSAYDGLRSSAFTVDDISAYTNRMVGYGAKFLDGNLYRGVEGVGPSKGSIPQYLKNWQLTADRGKNSQQEPHYGNHIKNTVLKNYIPTSGNPNGGGADPNFRSALKEPKKGYIRVSEYGFRGDTRPPVDIKALGGMNPNAIRDDRQEVRDKKEVLDNFDHQADWGSAYSGYVSWSRNIGSAYKFATDGIRNGVMNETWIYAARCRDAVDVEATFVNPRYKECEISTPGGTEWFDIVAWRRIFKKGGRFSWDSKIYVTTDQRILPRNKRAELLKLFSLPLSEIKKGHE